ncbi:hypothetical protein P4S72_17330 [Vibrio sp. PP-XX7]
MLKTNASEFNAFSSPNYPALAEYGVELTLYDENWLPGQFIKASALIIRMLSHPVCPC